MITFIYKEKVHTLDFDSFQNLLTNKTLLEYPMDYWKKVIQTAFDGGLNHYLLLVLEAKIKYNDSSSSVNEFYINDKKGWFNKATRQSLYRLCDSVDKNVEIILENEVISIPKNVLKEFLKELEVYAYQCYTQTENHLYTVTTFKTEQEFLDYDYTKDYPKKLVLSV